MKMKHFKKILMAIAGVVVLVLAFNLVIWLQGQKYEVAHGHPQRVDLKALDVREFHWIVDGKNFSYTRDDQNADWQPQVELNRLYERLAVLNSTDYLKMKAPKNPDLTLKVKIAGHAEYWEAAWAPGHLFWITGEYAGMGRKLSDQENALFLEGRLAFAEHRLEWCPARIQKLAAFGAVWEFKEGSWTYRGDANRTQAAAGASSQTTGTIMEDWMGLYCRFAVDRYIDPVLDSPSMFLAEKVEAIFSNKAERQIKLNKDKVFAFENMFFRSKSLEAALTSLK